MINIPHAFCVEDATHSLGLRMAGSLCTGWQDKTVLAGTIPCTELQNGLHSAVGKGRRETLPKMIGTCCTILLGQEAGSSFTKAKGYPPSPHYFLVFHSEPCRELQCIMLLPLTCSISLANGAVRQRSPLKLSTTNDRIYR